MLNHKHSILFIFLYFYLNFYFIDSTYFSDNCVHGPPNGPRAQGITLPPGDAHLPLNADPTTCMTTPRQIFLGSRLQTTRWARHLWCAVSTRSLGHNVPPYEATSFSNYTKAVAPRGQRLLKMPPPKRWYNLQRQRPTCQNPMYGVRIKQLSRGLPSTLKPFKGRVPHSLDPVLLGSRWPRCLDQ